MANTPSAKKAARKMARKTEVNKHQRSRMRGFIRELDEAIEAGNQDVARSTFVKVQPIIMKAASKGILHKNTASRKVSRMSARVKSMTA